VLHRHAKLVSARAVRGGHRHRRQADHSWFGPVREVLGSSLKTGRDLALSVGAGLVTMGVLDAVAGAGAFATGLTASAALSVIRRKRARRPEGDEPAGAAVLRAVVERDSGPDPIE
jgi:hypothetical protein